MKRIPRKARTILAVSAAAALTLTAAGCGGGPVEVKTPAGTVELINAEAITTCTNIPYPPFQMEDKDGEVVGFDVDIVDLVAKKLELKQEIRDVKFDSIKSGAALAGGECDVAAAGMTITPERKENLTFSDPYYDEVLGFMSPKGDTVESIDQVKKDKLKLGVQTGTTSLDYAKEAGLDPTRYEDSGKQLQALKSGKVDVILQDLPVVNDWLTDKELAADFERGGVVKTGAQYGIGLKKDANKKLVEVINDSIAESKKDKTYDKLFEKWFGMTPEELANS